jgi:hypothetical protein
MDPSSPASRSDMDLLLANFKRDFTAEAFRPKKVDYTEMGSNILNSSFNSTPPSPLMKNTEISLIKLENMQLRGEIIKQSAIISSLNTRVDGLEKNLNSLFSLVNEILNKRE